MVKAASKEKDAGKPTQPFYDQLVEDFKEDITQLEALLEIPADIYREKIRDAIGRLCGKRNPIGYDKIDVRGQSTGALFLSDGSRMIGRKEVNESDGVVYAWAIGLELLNSRGKRIGSHLIEKYTVADGWPGD